VGVNKPAPATPRRITAYPRLPRQLLDILEQMELDKRSGNVVLNYRNGRLMGLKREEHFPIL